jgi:hypothetical protein
MVGMGFPIIYLLEMDARIAWVERHFHPLRGVSQHFLSGSVAIHAYAVNLKRISVSSIATLVRTRFTVEPVF